MASVEFSGDHVCFEYVNRPTFHEGERKRTIIPFLFPVTLTFELLNYLLPQLLMHTAQVISNQFEFDVSTVLRFRKILRIPHQLYCRYRSIRCVPAGSHTLCSEITTTHLFFRISKSGV